MTRVQMAQDAVLASLREDISTGRLRPGDKIPQEALAERYGTSRVPLREALKTLEAEGMVDYHANRGYFVAELSVADLLEVYRMRELLEAEAIRLAIPQLADADVDAIAELLRQTDDAAAAGDLRAMTDANRRFHFAIFDAANMPRLSRMLRQLWDATDVYRSMYYSDAGNRARVAVEHAAMLDALRRRDADSLVAHQDAHRSFTIDSVRHALNHPVIKEKP